MKTILKVFQDEPKPNQLLIEKIVQKAASSDLIQVSFKAWIEKGILPIVVDVHPEIDQFKNAVMLKEIPDLSLPLDWDLIFDRLTTKWSKKTIWTRLVSLLGIDRWLIDYTFGIDVPKNKDDQHNLVYCLLVSAILDQIGTF